MTLGLQLISNGGGAPSGRAGSPIDVGTCKVSGCHNSFELNTGGADVSITTNAPAAGYMPGETFTITVKAKETGKRRFGFEAIAVAADPSSTTSAGNVTITDANRTKLNPGANQYVTQTLSGNSGTDSISWSFDWTAPATAVGPVVFYSAINVTNANGNTAGDHIYTRRDTILQVPGTGIETVKEILAAKLFPSPASDLVRLELDVQDYTAFEVKVSDLSGRQVFSLEDDAYPGPYATTFDVSDWKTGIYLVSLHTGREVSHQKLTVVH